MRAVFKKASVCECGFPILKDEIQIGAIYEADTAKRGIFTLICGGCKSRMAVDCIYIAASKSGEGGYLPKEIFDLSEN